MNTNKFLLTILLTAAALQFKAQPDRYHFQSKGNPVITHHYSADPAALVREDTLWLFTGHDFAGNQKGYKMKDWLVFSTIDLKNWTEYPVPLKITDFAWAKNDDAYAGHVSERGRKYYWYVSTNGSGIGVAVADRPEGPYKDALGKPLLTNKDCFASTHSWACIDPAVFIDDDGQAWIFWGNRECYYAKLKENMLEIDGEVKQMTFDNFNFEEAPWIHKYNGKYYLSYATGFPEKIAYAMADRIDGHYEYKGILNEIAGNSNTNHQSIVQFGGEWRFIYHNGAIQPDGGSFSRSVCIDNLHHNPDGSIKRIRMTTEGVLRFGLSAQPVFTQWASTPPMGWNSWDCYGPTVEEHEVKANADYMAKHLKSFGWEYIVVDIRWFVENDKAGGYNQTDPRYVIDEYGRYRPAVNRFPSAANGKGFKPLADYIHSKGLKFGIHIMRGVPKAAVERKLPVKGANGITADQIYSTELQCPWLRDNYTVLDKPGAQEYYNSIFELYASWGVDFIKIDDLSRPYHKTEIEMIRKAIDRTGRPIVLSMSPGETPVTEAKHAATHANMWRMVDDVWDTWGHLTHLMKVAEGWYPYISPTYPDCDMIPLGRISIRGERGNDRMTRLTRDEQYSLTTFFSIFRSPLMFGGDLPSNDEFTLSLLTNKEVLRMHRESANVRQLFKKDGKLAVASDNPQTGERYLALFNISDNPEPMDIQVDLRDAGIDKKGVVTNMWTGETVASSTTCFPLHSNPMPAGCMS
jgi:hypothetical protein